MKITILTTTDFPYGLAAENFVRQIALGLHQNNATVEVVRYNGDDRLFVNDTPIKCSNYIFRRPLRNEFLKVIKLILEVLYIPFFILIRKIKHKDEAILLIGLDKMFYVAPFIVFCRITNIKCYRTIAEIFPDYLVSPFWWRKPLVIFYSWQLKYIDRYLTGIVVLSSYLKKLCVKNGVKNERIILIPHFINVNVNYVNPIVHTDFKIGYCGLPSIENGIIDLLMAFEIIQQKYFNLELIIMGEIPKMINDIIEEGKFNLTNVKFTGLLNKKEVEIELEKCSILVNPRKSGVLADSGFPTKLGEYFSCIKPVVSTKVGDLAYYFTDKKELVFAEPNDPKSISDAILFLYENQEKAKIIGVNGFKWASENLDYIQNTKKLLNFFNLFG